MNRILHLVFEGDGRGRLDEIVFDQLQKTLAELATDSSLLDSFQSHPNLFSIEPATLFQGLSRKKSGAWIESGALDEFAGKKSTTYVPDAILGRGRRVECSLPLSVILSGLDLLPPGPALTSESIELLYEDSDLLAVLKPHTLPSAPLHSDEMDSAVQRVLRLRPNLPILRGNPLEPGLIHRLDTGTSGVLLFAKTLTAFERVWRGWNTGEVEKEYRALVCDPQGVSKPGRFDLEMGHDAKSKRKMRVVQSAVDRKRIRGEALLGKTEILEVIPMQVAGLSDLRIRIQTGIHHQIRATLAHLGTPIRGDTLYGGIPSDRLWLHASGIKLPDRTGKILDIRAPLPVGY